MRKRLIPIALLAVAAATLASCGPSGSSTTGGTPSGDAIEAPVIFWNRQPTDSNNVADKSVMTDSRFKHIYYVGFDAIQGGQIQGQMIVDYVKDQISKGTEWGKAIKAKGEVTYDLIIGQVDHNDSAARTAGVRDALHTRQDNPTSNANQEQTKEGYIDLDDGTKLKVREVANGEAKSTAGATWDAAKAGELVAGWFSASDTKGDMIVSNNDGMAYAAATQVSTNPTLVPIFGYDSNAENLTAIKADANKTSGAAIVGTVNQNAPAQAAAIMLAARNVLDGSADPIGDIVNKKDNGYGTISDELTYNADTHALLVNNFAITASNVAEYEGKTPDSLALTTITQGSKGAKKVFLDYYSNTDTFLNSTMKPLFGVYAKQFQYTVDEQAGDGNSDSSVIDKLLSKADAYLVNPVKPTAAASYLNTIAGLEGK